jgi:hypothetical protein
VLVVFSATAIARLLGKAFEAAISTSTFFTFQIQITDPNFSQSAFSPQFSWARGDFQVLMILEMLAGRIAKLP